MNADTIQLKTPGLYLQGLEPEPNPPVVSGVTGFVGVTAEGPLNQPQPIRNWGEFLDLFGGFIPYGYLPRCVFGFFLNGGQLCYVVRVANPSDLSPDGETGECEKVNPLLKSSTLKKIDEDNAVRVRAINEGSWGNRVEVKINAVSPQNARFSFQYKDKEKRETFTHLSLIPGDPNYFVDVINGDPGLTGYIQRGKKGHSILVNVEHITASAVISSLPDDTGEPVLLEGGGDGFVNARGQLMDNGNKPSLLVVSKRKGKAGNDIRVQATPFTTNTALRIPGDARKRLTVENIKDFFDEKEETFDETLVNETLTISSETGVEEDRVIDSADKDEHVLILTGDIVGNFPVGSVVSVKNRFNIIVKTDKSVEPLEIFYNLSMDEDSSRYFKTIINSNSDYICVDHAKEGEREEPPVDEIPLTGGTLTGGKDPGQIDYHYYTGYEDNNGTYSYFQNDGIDPDQRLGLATLEQVEDVSLVAVPDLERIDHDLPKKKGEGENYKSAQTHILFHCRKMGERFALLDPMEGKVIALEPDTEKNKIAPPVFSDKDARFGALYYPWVHAAFEEEIELVPPSGFIAGIMAQTDRQYGTHKAPANVKIKGGVDLETLIDKSLQDDLNEAGINCIRKFEDGMIKVWGARTLSKENKWRYVNVRRTFLSMIKILSKELLWAVFEPNHRELWQQIEAAITAFLNNLFAGGMTAGKKPDEAFYVRCNEETNPPEVEEAGQVIAEVGVALSAPAEFIVITVKKTPESLSVIEEEV
jgi:hypothetical protein